MVTTVPRSKGGQNPPPCSRHVSPSFWPMQIKTAALVKHRTPYLLNVRRLRRPFTGDGIGPSARAALHPSIAAAAAQKIRIPASRMLFRGIVCRTNVPRAGDGSQPCTGAHAIVKAGSGDVA